MIRKHWRYIWSAQPEQQLSIRQLCFFWHSEIAAFVKGFRKDQKLRLTIESQPYPHRIYPGNTAILLIRKFAGSSVHSAMKSIFLMRRKSFCWNTLRRNDVISWNCCYVCLLQERFLCSYVWYYFWSRKKIMIISGAEDYYWQVCSSFWYQFSW